MPSVLKSLQFSFPVPLKMNLSQCGRRIHSSKHCVPVHTERVAISIPVQFWGSMYSSERSQSPSTPEYETTSIPAYLSPLSLSTANAFRLAYLKVCLHTFSTSCSQVLSSSKRFKEFGRSLVFCLSLQSFFFSFFFLAFLAVLGSPL